MREWHVCRCLVLAVVLAWVGQQGEVFLEAAQQGVLHLVCRVQYEESVVHQLP
jgi:hypothetical protein